MKLHSTAPVTLALKSIAMSFRAADYYGHPRSKQEHEHHFFEDMHSFSAAMARRFPIDLAITVGHPAMIGAGPLGGYVVETGLVLASTDALAADVVGAKLLGFGPQAVRHLWEAAHLGLGETSTQGLLHTFQQRGTYGRRQVRCCQLKHIDWTLATDDEDGKEAAQRRRQ